MRILKETIHRVLVEQIGHYWNTEWAIYEKEDDGSIGAMEFHTSNKELAEEIWEKRIGQPRWKDTEKCKELRKSTWEFALSLGEAE